MLLEARHARRFGQPQPPAVCGSAGTLPRLRQPHRLVHPHQPVPHQPPPPRTRRQHRPCPLTLARQLRHRPPRPRRHILVPRPPPHSRPRTPGHRATHRAARRSAPPPRTAHPTPPRHRGLHPTPHRARTSPTCHAVPARPARGAAPVLPLPRPVPPRRHPLRCTDPPTPPLHPPPRPHPRRINGNLDTHVCHALSRPTHPSRIRDGRLRPGPTALHRADPLARSTLPLHAAAPQAADLALAEWEVFDPLLHHSHMHPRLPTTIRHRGRSN